MTEKTHWAVCRTFSSRVHRVRPEIEKANHGTFLPSYAALWIKDGRPWSRERALMPGYLFFLTEPEGWGGVSNVDGVYAVLSNAGRASRVSDAEMQRMVLDHAMGVHNQIEATIASKSRYGRRKSRPSKRARERRASLGRAILANAQAGA